KLLDLYNCENLESLVKKADVLASSFDRYLIMEKYKDITSLIRSGLANPFLPSINILSKPLKNNELNNIRSELIKLIDECIKEIVQEISKYLKSDNEQLGLFYHLLSFLLEPMLYRCDENHPCPKSLTEEEVAKNLVTPADTRVPHHSIFDHLFATATAVNMASKSGDGLYSFIILRISLDGIKDWITGSRKLSDLWFSSWMLGAWIWYIVEELVEKLGPDILVFPEHRWNQHYISLLYKLINDKGKISGSLIEEIASSIYWFDKDHPFPHYAWIPSQMYLFIPLVRDPGISGIRGINVARREKIDEYADDLVKHIAERYIGFWQKIVENILDRVEEAIRKIDEQIRNERDEDKKKIQTLRREYVDRIHKALRDVMGKPPLTLSVTVVKVLHNAQIPGYNYLLNANVYKIYGQISSDSGGTSIGKIDLFPEYMTADLSSNIVLDKLRKLLNELPGDKQVSFTKLLYTIAFWLTEYLGLLSKTKNPVPNRLLPSGYGSDQPWKSCTVCRHGVAYLRVPNEEGYEDFATSIALVLKLPEDIEKVTDIVRKIFKPGERLCPYCIVKRLSGTRFFITNILEEIYDYLKCSPNSPQHNMNTCNYEIDIVFPATDDIAGLAYKLGLVESLIIIRDKGDILGEKYVQYVEKLAEKARKLCDEIGCSETRRASSSKRLYFPWLLNEAVKKLISSGPRRNSSSSDNPETRDEKLEDNFEIVRDVVLSVLKTPLYDLLDKIGNSKKYREFIDTLSIVLSEISGALGDSDSDRHIKLLIRDIIMSLRKPRTNYAIVYFDADMVSRTMIGLIKALGKGDEYIDAKKYLEYMLASLREAYSRSSSDKQDIMKNFFELESSLKCMKLPDIIDGEATVLVTPSYHRAVANALQHVLFKMATSALLLGGVPVFMGGDEGLILLPAWLPLRMASYAVGDNMRDFYYDILNPFLKDVLQIFIEKQDSDYVETVKEKLLELGFYEPPLLYVLILRKLYWGSYRGASGFLPVTPKPMIFTDEQYYIPAVLSGGISIGVRLTHYKDHMYYSLISAINLARISKREGGDKITVLYGHVPTPAYQRSPGLLRKVGGEQSLPLSPMISLNDTSTHKQAVIRAGELISYTLLLNTLVENNVLTRSIYRDLYNLVPDIDDILSHDKSSSMASLQAQLLYSLISRNKGGRYNTLLGLLEKKQGETALYRIFSTNLVNSIIDNNACLPELLGVANIFYNASTRTRR
ncbi:MAG: hypothetical protein GXO26_02590, partial [Crenarchaeota archaeon]|nr:hypothetical protein [Thermoproteota archaeon]